jgi:hypothetical protein
MHRTSNNPGRCPRCGGKLEFKATVGRCDTGADVDFFQCNGCAYIHTVPPKTVPPKETKLAGG